MDKNFDIQLVKGHNPKRQKINILDERISFKIKGNLKTIDVAQGGGGGVLEGFLGIWVADLQREEDRMIFLFFLFFFFFFFF